MGDTEDRCRAASIKTMVEKLNEGLTIAVVGWRNSNHDNFTRSLDPRRFIFLDNEGRGMPRNTGYVLSTRFVQHAVWQQVQSRHIPIHPKVLQNGVIKGMLKDVRAVIRVVPVPQPQHPKAVTTPTAVPAPATSAGPVQSPSISLPPASIAVLAGGSTEGQQDKEQRFAVAFLEAVGNDPTATMSKYEAAKLLVEHFGEGHNPSQYKKLLEGVVADGRSKVGQYRATAALIELAGRADIEPTDPTERAKWLVSREPLLQSRRHTLQEEMECRVADIKAEIATIDVTLGRVGKAKAALAALEKSLQDI